MTAVCDTQAPLQAGPLGLLPDPITSCDTVSLSGAAGAATAAMNGELSHWEIARSALPDQPKRPFDQLASELAEVGRQQQLASHELSRGARAVGDAYDEFLSAMNPFDKPIEARLHWYNHFRDARLGKKFGEPPITQELLSGAAFGYLKAPMRVPLFDRALLDAFIAQETFAYIDRHAGRGQFLTLLGCFGVYAVAGLLGAIIFGNATPNLERLWWGLAIVLGVTFVMWFWPKRGRLALAQSMRDAYQLLSGSVVSVPELRRRIELARDQGVVWPPELYAVLDDVESRTKVL